MNRGLTVKRTPHFFVKVDTVNTGGGCMVDIIKLEDGRILGINDDSVVLYQSMEDFWKEPSMNEVRAMIDL